MTDDNDYGMDSVKAEVNRLKRYGGIPFDDIDDLLDITSQHIPFYDRERAYLYELDSQGKIYLGMVGVAIIMFIVSILI